MNREPDQNDTLDRLWAATRPEEPSAEIFDRIWAEVCDRASRPETLAFTPVASWKRWGLEVGVLAQAAAMMIAAFVALRQPDPAKVDPNGPITPPPQLARDHDSAKMFPPILLAAGTTAFVDLDRHGLVKEVKFQPQVPESNTDIQTAEADVLNFMESYE